jgi:hypothetical protein
MSFDSDEPDIVCGDLDSRNAARPHNPYEPPTPHQDGDDYQDLIDQDVTARDIEDLLRQDLVHRVLPPAAARRFLDGLNALDGQLPETHRRLIIKRVYETLAPLDP